MEHPRRKSVVIPSPESPQIAVRYALCCRELQPIARRLAANTVIQWKVFLPIRVHLCSSVVQLPSPIPVPLCDLCVLRG